MLLEFLCPETQATFEIYYYVPSIYLALLLCATHRCDNQLITRVRHFVRHPLKLKRLRKKPRGFPDICHIDTPKLSTSGKN